MSAYEQCPGCGAEYDCTGYQPGTQFACAHCGTPVFVAGAVPPPPPAPPQQVVPQQPGYEAGYSPPATPGYGAPPAGGAPPPRRGRPGRDTGRRGRAPAGYDHAGYGPAAHTGNQNKKLYMILGGAGAAVVLITVGIILVVCLGGGDSDTGTVASDKTAEERWRDEEYPILAGKAGDDKLKHYNLAKEAAAYGFRDIAHDEYRIIVDLGSDEIALSEEKYDADKVTGGVKIALEKCGYEWLEYYELVSREEFAPREFKKKAKWLVTGSPAHIKAMDDQAAYDEWFRDGVQQQISNALGRVVRETKKRTGLENKDWAADARGAYIIFIQRTKRSTLKMAFDEYFKMLGDLVPQWQEFTKDVEGIGEINEKKMQIFVLFKDSAAYQQYAQMPNAAGHYQNKNRMMFAYKGSDDRGTVFHECTHQLNHATLPMKPKRITWSAYRRGTKVWFIEGLATHYEVFKQVGKIETKYVLGGMNAGRLGEAKRALDEGWLTLDTVLNERLNMDDMVSTARVYGGGWSLTYFLLHGENGKYEDAFYKFFSSAIHGKGQPQDFKRVFADEGYDINKLEEEYLNWIRTTQAS